MVASSLQVQNGKKQAKSCLLCITSSLPHATREV